MRGIRPPRVKLSVRQNIIIAAITGSVLGILLVAIFGAGFMYAIGGFSGGWEVRTNMEKIYIGGSQNKWYTATTSPLGDIPWGPKSVQFDPSVRADNPNWEYNQEPDIYVAVDDPIHTAEDDYNRLLKDADGKKVISAPLDEYVREIAREVGTETRYYYHHTYAYTVTVKTECDLKDLGGFYQAIIESKGEEGVALQFTIRTKFAISPWQIIGDYITDEATGETYRVSTAWAGVMAASYEIVDAGFSDRTMQAKYEIEGSSAVLAIVSSGWDWTKPSLYQACDMWEDVDAIEEAENEVPTQPQFIEDIPQTVYIDVSGMLFAGTKQGALIYPQPYNLYMMFTIRVDVLTCAGFTPVSGTNPLPDPPDDVSEGPAPFLYPLFYAMGVWWGQNWWMVGLVLFIIVAVLVLVLFTRIRVLIAAIMGR